MIAKFTFDKSSCYEHELECKLNERLSDRDISDEQIISVESATGDKIVIWYKEASK